MENGQGKKQIGKFRKYYRNKLIGKLIVWPVCIKVIFGRIFRLFNGIVLMKTYLVYKLHYMIVTLLIIMENKPSKLKPCIEYITSNNHADNHESPFSILLFHD